VCPSPTAAYTPSGTELNYAFSDNSSPGTTSWFWDFGDGNTSTMQNPSHTYAMPGMYTVCLIASNACGADTSCTPITVTCTAPVSAFADSIDGLNFFFTDQSTNAPTSWFWDFGDGNSSTLQNPNHSYAMPGLYTVCLISASICGSDTSCTLETAICAQPEAGFSFVTNGANVQFTDTSAINPTDWIWDFGDGNSSTLQNPSHTYTASGNYPVCLTASSVCGSDSACATVSILIIGREDPLQSGLLIHSNPSNGQIHLLLSGGESIRQVTVLDLYGRQIAEFAGNGTANLPVDLSRVYKGVCFVQVESESGRYVKRIVVE
jgi:PKD repeat protein